jgi:hypothetical protein
MTYPARGVVSTSHAQKIPGSLPKRNRGPSAIASAELVALIRNKKQKVINGGIIHG